MNNKIALSIITKEPNEVLLNFLRKIDYIDIYIFIDNNDYQIIDNVYSRNVYFIKNMELDCIFKGFQWSTRLYLNPNSLRVCSWDKALFYFSYINTKRDFIWMIEDDVLIPHENIFKNLNNKYLNNENDFPDLITKSHIKFNGDFNEWHWIQAIDSFDLKNTKLYCSMVPALGLSQKLIFLIKEHALKKGFLPLTEIMFNSIAETNNLKIITIEELSNITYRDKFEYKNINTLYHPVKDFDNHDKYREDIIQFSNVQNNNPPNI